MNNIQPEFHTQPSVLHTSTSVMPTRAIAADQPVRGVVRDFSDRCEIGGESWGDIFPVGV
jgi:hypothetical protein